jgi:hypothetical protein
MNPRIFLVVVAFVAGPACAADPVVIRLPEKANAATAVVTLGQVAEVSGGNARLRARMLDLDLADRSDTPTITRRQVEWRLKLAGFRDEEFLVMGANTVTLTSERKLLSSDRVVAAAKVELAKRLGKSTNDLFLDLVQPVLAKLPMVDAGDEVDFDVSPNGGTVRLGRTQMNVTILVNGVHKLTLPVHLHASTVPASVATKTPVVEDSVLVKARQEVKMQVRVGDLIVGTFGEALQDGKLGQSIAVRNVDSKKIVTGTVSGPGVVDIESGGGR